MLVLSLEIRLCLQRIADGPLPARKKVNNKLLNHVILTQKRFNVNLLHSLRQPRVYNSCMTIPNEQLLNLPILSLETSEPVGRVVKPVVQLDNLQVVALRCLKAGSRHSYLLLVSDIRQLTGDYLIVNSEADLVGLDDVVRIRQAVEANYDPVGRSVATDAGLHRGIVHNYAIDPLTSFIVSLSVGPRVFIARNAKLALIHRRQIVDVTPRQIIIQDAMATETPAGALMPDAAA